MKHPQLTEEEIKKHFQAIIEDNRKHPPKPRRAKCNDCQRRIFGTAKCSLYPNMIPKEILLNREECPEFEQK